MERMKAGKSALLSVGYQPVDTLIIRPEDYATEIPKYSKPAFVAANIQKAGQFPQVRILLKEQLFEGALVSVPMLNSAAVTAVKSSDSDGTHGGMTLEEQGRQAHALVTSYNDRLKAVVRLALETKVGAAISQARRDRIGKWGQTLRQMADEFDELLDETAPKPKEEEDDKESKQLIADVTLAMVLRDIARRGVPIR
jgi:acyl-CoA reductase-like NAD-dependent aldehyde dehydrogenase